MSGLLLDTNIVSFILKKDTRAGSFSSLLQGELLSISFMTAAELYRWSIERSWGKAKIENLEVALSTRYVVLPYDRELGWEWARVMARCAGAGRTIAPADAWVAATACRHNLPLLTHNVKHFEAPEELCGLELMQ